MHKKILMSLLVYFMSVGIGFAQSNNLSGVVTNAESGNPLIGANVYIPALELGASTNLDGFYEIKGIPVGRYEILVTYVGFNDKTVFAEVVAGDNKLDISLDLGLALDELIVTAFGISREKKSVVYQTTTVDSDNIVKSAPTNVAEGLIGKVAGLQINRQSSGVRSQNQIILRGLRSVSQSNEALIVIDGSIVTSGAFNDMNPNDIENINVLKGATAVALYGSAASNGALIVTTKRGRTGTAYAVNYIHSTTWEEVAYMPSFQSKFGSGFGPQYDPIENTAWGPRFDGQLRRIGYHFPDGYHMEDQMVPYAPIKDGLKKFFDTGLTSQHTVSLSGGDATGSFYFSVGTQDRAGIMPHDEYSRNNFTANGTKIMGDVTLGVNASYFSDKSNVVGNNIGDQERTIYWFILNNPAQIPLSTYKDWENPNSYAYANNYFNAYYQNPYWAIGTNRTINETNRLRGNISASWNIMKNINATGRIGLNNVSSNGKDWRAAQEYDPALQPAAANISSYVTDSESQYSGVTGSFITTGDFKLTDDIGFKTILGTSVETTKQRNSTLTANNLSIPGFYDISNGTGEVSATVGESQKRTIGIFGDLTFSYKEWAFVNVTGRQDYTSTLPKDDNSYFYPGGGVSIIANEAISSLKNISEISLVKFTANYSTLYKDLAPYQINERYTQSGTFPFGSINGFFLSGTAVDKNIKPEKLSTLELGMNTAFFSNRLTFDAAYFTTDTRNLLTSVSPSNASGSTGYLTNIGKLSGSGLELTLGGKIINTRNLVWDFNLNYTSYEQKVVEMEGDEIAIAAAASYGIYAVKGEVFPQLKAIGYERDPKGRVIIDRETGNPLIGGLQSFGKTTPDYILGFTSSVSSYGFTLSATLDYRTGHVYYAQGQDAMEFTGRSVESALYDRMPFVFPNSSYDDGTGNYVENTNIPTADGGYSFFANHYNSIKENYVKDATALKLRELSLIYTVPSKFLKSTKAIKGMKVGIIGRNLLTSLPTTQSTFSDPEFNNSGGTSNAIGIGGYYSPPPTRSYGFNVNIEF